MIEKLLVANRGEIARRIFRTCRELGIATVAVYSEPDAQALFVHEADEAVPLGGRTSGDSYLRAGLVVAAAVRVGADAVHPGYGFLSENADFARACGEAGLTFVGPTIEAIEAMGSKITAREMMARAGVPVLPGRDLTGVADADFAAVADEVGWPVLVKASYGGGGRGMRLVREPARLAEAVASARREAGAAFGNDTVFLEHYVDEPRHVEIQLFGDMQGTIVHLNERECSIQRRHQKIIEESPSPAVGPELRARMGAAAVEAGRALGYVGAGTVEFLLAPTGDFYFLEVNTRLQVEHPVTEAVTGLDLVRLQLEVADGNPLPQGLADIAIEGHAIEARLYAEDAARDFLPVAGTIHEFAVPEDPGLRLDSGVVSGDVVSTNYDPMLAKVIAWGRTRDEARARLARALRRTKVHGIPTNRALLVGVLEHEEFAAGRIDTHFLDRHQPSELVDTEPVEIQQAAALAAALAAQQRRRSEAKVLATVASGFRSVHSQLQHSTYQVADRSLSVGYRLGRTPMFEVDGNRLDVEVVDARPGSVDLVVAGVRRTFEVRVFGAMTYVSWAGGSLALNSESRFPVFDEHVAAGSLLAPMPGTIVRVTVAEGDLVDQGQTLMVLEAMKMQLSITSPVASVVASIPVAAGQTVDIGASLIVLSTPDGTDVGGEL